VTKYGTPYDSGRVVNQGRAEKIKEGIAVALGDSGVRQQRPNLGTRKVKNSRKEQQTVVRRRTSARRCWKKGGRILRVSTNSRKKQRKLVRAREKRESRITQSRGRVRSML